MVTIKPTDSVIQTQSSGSAAVTKQTKTKSTIFDGEIKQQQNSGEPKEPQFVTQYGKTKLPDGSVLKKEVIVYGYDDMAYVPGYRDINKKQKTAGIILLPNGVEITIIKSPESNGEYPIKDRSIKIKDDGTVVFKDVEFTSLIGTDNDDKFEFTGVRACDNGSLNNFKRVINTGRGNDEITNPGLWSGNDGSMETMIVSNENLTLKGNADDTTIFVNGNLDTTMVSFGRTSEMQASMDKKTE